MAIKEREVLSEEEEEVTGDSFVGEDEEEYGEVEAGSDADIVEEDDELEELKQLRKKVAGIPKKRKLKAITKEELKEYEESEKRKGLIYLSRIPPFMKPAKLRHIMSQFGEVGKLYLQMEDPRIRKKRVKMGGNTKKNYTEGWVEFMDKRVAKRIALSLNNTLIGGKKGSFYHDDMWNIKYLPKFKWNMLTESIALQRAAHEQRIKAEISQVRKENATYLENLDKSKMIMEMETRKKKKAKEAEGGDAKEASSSKQLSNASKIKMQFRQRKLVNSTDNKKIAARLAESL
eukprot:Nk52_evm3s337 gene=Nk52_evmTU3s337